MSTRSFVGVVESDVPGTASWEARGPKNSRYYTAPDAPVEVDVDE